MGYLPRKMVVALLFVFAVALATPNALANPIVPFTLRFETEGLDLDTGTVVRIESGATPANASGMQPDLIIAYNAARDVHAVVLHNQAAGVKMAFLEDVPFSRVGLQDLATLRLELETVDRPFAPGSSMVLCTDLGAHYLLGNPVESDTDITFDTRLLERTPPGGSSAGDRGDGLVARGGKHLEDASRYVISSSEDVKLVASDPAPSDYFGLSVSISGNTLVISAPYDTHAGASDAGSAYVFVRDGERWLQQDKLTANDAEYFDYFGKPSVWGNTVVIGAPWTDHSGGISVGSAYVFVRSGTNWYQQRELNASDAAFGDTFGYSVALLEDTAIVGAPQDDSSDGVPDTGSAYVFVRSGTSWSEQAKLTASDEAIYAEFGSSAAISGETAIIGAPEWEIERGATYIYVRDGTEWTEQAKLTASDQLPFDEFGYSVSISGDTAVIGAPEDDHDWGPQQAGSAYVFVRSGTVWTEQVRLTASDASENANFGRGVAIDGDLMVIGAAYEATLGAAYVFSRDGTEWTEMVKLTASDGYASDIFGGGVALEDEFAAVGASGKRLNTWLHVGAAYVFDCVLTGDCDGDDLPNSNDNCRYVHNVGQSDADSDGVGDVCDNCPATNNSDQLDGDSDGWGDPCDACPGAIGGDGGDWDSDGVINCADNCPHDHNIDQDDSDSDDVGDLCDLCPGDAVNDPDDDGVCASEDNCGSIRNPLQLDDDDDLVGNLCDTCPQNADSGQEDGDSDGVGDACDCQPLDPNDRQPGEVLGVTVHQEETGTQIEWISGGPEDIYSVSRGVISALTTGNYGACLDEGIDSDGFEDTEIPPSGDGFFYLVQAQHFGCGLGTLGYATSEEERVNANPSACQGYPFTDVYAESEETIYGSVVGTYSDTWASDDVLEQLTEETTSGSPSSRYTRLEHRWTFQVPAGSHVELHAESFHTVSDDNDDFVFEQSIDGVNFTAVDTILRDATVTDADVVYLLPSDLEGSVIIRVVDTMRQAGPGATSEDTISVDELFIRSIP